MVLISSNYLNRKCNLYFWNVTNKYQGTFEDGVEYVLCLATSSSVILLSVDFIRYTKGNGAIVNEMKFSPQPIYSIQTENMIVNTIKASKSTGRLFMGAKDGCLYEFFYQVGSCRFPQVYLQYLVSMPCGN